MLVDLTLPLNEETLLIPNDYEGGGFRSESMDSQEDGTGVVHRFCQNTHTGTHVDAGRHYNVEGEHVDELSLETLRGEAKVVDLRDHAGELIDADVLDATADHLEAGDRAIFVTGDVDAHFHEPDDPELRTLFEEAATFSVDAAEWMTDRGLSLIANDFVTESIELSKGKPYDPDRPVHLELCGANVPIVEYLCNVDAIADAETVELTCLPLPLTGFEASPVRVVAEL